MTQTFPLWECSTVLYYLTRAMPMEKKPLDGWKWFQFVFSCFLYLVKSVAFQCRKAKTMILTTLKNLYSLLQISPVILIHWYFLETMLIFWGLCCLLYLKLCLEHIYLLCLNFIWVHYDTFMLLCFCIVKDMKENYFLSGLL